MQNVIRIGTRGSRLAIWQAKYVEDFIKAGGFLSKIKIVKSEGDLNLTAPLYEMGVQGIFTKTLDIALLNDEIDLAVHSFKDVPTRLPEALCIAAIPPRGNWKDSLVYKSPSFDPELRPDAVLATSSLRRKAQWLHRYPGHRIEPIRGNNQTRLEKLEQHPHWDGALFASAGIERIQLQVPFRKELDWMLPAPAQGALAVVCRKGDERILSVCREMNDPETALCTSIEREFLRSLMGGCSMPIAALALIETEKIRFRGSIFSLDGSRKAEIDRYFSYDQGMDAGRRAALALLSSGGETIAGELKNLVKP